jgi:hypothetical protein
MNNAYDIARYRFVTAGLDWRTLNLQLTAWGGTPNFIPTDTLISDITTRNVTTLLGTSQPITAKAVTSDGTVQTNQVLIPNVPVGPDVTHFIMGETGGQLIYFVDDALNLPFTPNGLDIVVQPDWSLQRGWFRA